MGSWWGYMPWWGCAQIWALEVESDGRASLRLAAAGHLATATAWPLVGQAGASVLLGLLTVPVGPRLLVVAAVVMVGSVSVSRHLVRAPPWALWSRCRVVAAAGRPICRVCAPGLLAASQALPVLPHVVLLHPYNIHCDVCPCQHVLVCRLSAGTPRPAACILLPQFCPPCSPGRLLASSSVCLTRAPALAQRGSGRVLCMRHPCPHHVCGTPCFPPHPPLCTEGS